MRSYLIEMFGVSLALTIAVELAVAFPAERIGNPSTGRTTERLQGGGEGPGFLRRLRLRSGKRILLVVLVNVLTNPPAVLLCWLARLYLPAAAEFPVQLAAEAGVIAVEAGIYRSFTRKPWWGIRRPVMLAVVLNLCSWLSGMALNLWRGVPPIF